MLYDEEMSGHDSRLEAVAIDVLQCIVSVQLASYPSLDARKRIAIEITFRDVEAIQTTADLGELKLNHAAGNVNYWHIAEGAGTSYIYLVEGFLAITARTKPTLSYR